MISFSIYPVLDGIEVWVAASCLSHDPRHSSHQGASAAGFLAREDLDRLGVAGALTRLVEEVLSEFPEIATRATC